MSQLSEDTVDAAELAVPKENILERINKRNKDRQNYLDIKLEQRNKENLQLEGADYFAQSFTQRVHEIEARIQNISELAAKKTNNTAISNAELTHLFADITMEIKELQHYLTTSTMFLTDFKIKSCQQILTELNNSCEETRQKLMPKKKFGFSGRKVAPKAAVNPKINASDKLDASHHTAKTIFEHTLANRSAEYICLQGDEVDGKDITITNLNNCMLELKGHAGSVQMSNVMDCTIVCGPIARSFFAENCQNSKFAVACQQLRLHSSRACRIYLHVTCRAIIEDCNQIEIAPYNYHYPLIDNDFEKAGLSKSQNNYTDVADFNWLSPDVPSPNWKILKQSDETNWQEIRANFNNKTNGLL